MLILANIAFFRTDAAAQCVKWQYLCPPEGFSTATNSHWFNVAADGAGTPYVVYHDYSTTSPHGKISVKKYNGTTWNYLGSAGFSSGVVGTDYNIPNIAVNSSGEVYVAYLDAGEGHKAIVKKFDGTSWVYVGGAAVSPGGVSSVCMRIDGSDNVFIVYGDSTNGTKATVKKFDGTSWSIVGTAGFTSGSVERLSLAINNSGTPYVMQSPSLLGNVTVMRFNGTDWVNVGTPGFVQLRFYNNSMDIDASGNIYIAGALNGSDAYVARYDGSNWTNISSGASIGNTDFLAIAVDNYGIPYITYEDYSTNWRNSMMKYNGTTWESIGGTSYGSCATTSATKGRDGNIYIVYNQQTYAPNKTTVIKINPSYASLSGNKTVCTSATTSLIASPAGGTWMSGNESVATVGSSSGIVSGIAGGTAVVSYTIGGCVTTLTVTVNAFAGAISGTSTLPVGSQLTLYNDMAIGGTWTSSNTSVATIGSGSGVITGITGGTSVISYTKSSACGTAMISKTITVNTTASTCNSWTVVGNAGFSPNSISEAGATVDNNGIPYVVFSDSSYGQKISVMKYDGSSWVYVGTRGFTPSVPSYRPHIRCDLNGTPYIDYPDAAYRPIVMKYDGSDWVYVGTSPFSPDATEYGAFSGPLDISRNGIPYIGLNGVGIGGESFVLKYDESTWGILGNVNITPTQLAYRPLRTAIGNDGTVYSLYTYTSSGVYKYLLSKFAGGGWVTLNDTLTGSNNDNVQGFSIDGNNRIYLAYETPASFSPLTFHFIVKMFNGISWSNVGSLPAATNTNGCSFAIGSDNVPYIAYTTGNSDIANAGKISVSKFDGSSWTLVGTAAFTNKSYSSPYLAISESNIPYLAYGDRGNARKFTVLKMNTSILASIGGTSTLCTGSTSTLTNVTTGGTWSTSDSSIATVAANGVVTGVAAGTAIISYSLNNSANCTVTKIVTVTLLADAGVITGPSTVLAGNTITLSDAVAGGVWSSSNTANATVGTNGVVSGVHSGTTTISYAVAGTCSSGIATMDITVTVPPISGTLTISGSGTTQLANPVAGGTWSTGCDDIATVDEDGLVTAHTSGMATVTYSTAAGITTSVVTVNSATTAIAGSLTVCTNSSSFLSHPQTGGTWSIDNMDVATIDATTGMLSGLNIGTATITYSYGSGCYSTAVITVNQAPAPITGNALLCVGTTTTLSDATPGGTWSSVTPFVATVNTSGVVTGMAVSGTTISYTISNGCAATRIVTVNPAGNAGTITGASTVETGATITLSNMVTGGIWSVNNANATIDSFGIVTGAMAGTTTVSYSVATSCGTAVATKTVTVTAPALPSITGILSVCTGAATTLTIATTGGYWTSSATAIAYVNTTGVVTGMAAGTATITYTLMGNSTTAVVTVSAAPAAITGTATMCAGNSATWTDATTGGTWNSDANASVTAGGVVTGITAGTAIVTYTSGNGCSVNKTLTIYATPATIAGTANTCIGAATTLTNTVTGGTWSSSATSIVSVGAASGIVTGLAVGTATITYTVAGGCKTTTGFTVNATPAAITGTMKACPGTSTTLADATTGGTWTSGDMSIASIGSATGIVTGTAAGVVSINYSSGAGCSRTTTVTINPLPAAIAGTTSICTGSTTALTDPTTGGLSWTSSNTAIATINTTSGVATGVAVGTATITYTLGTGCFITTTLSVNALPTAISGTLKVCAGTATTLVSGTGTWSSSNTTVATIGSSTGIATGVAAGTATITYAESAGCYRTAVLTVTATPAAIAGYGITCLGASVSLTDATGGGTWSSGNTAIATVGSATGVITGTGVGNTNITYTLGGACSVVKVVTINATLAPSTGAAIVCMGGTTTLANTTTDGMWTSSNTGIATVDASSGVVTTLYSTGTVNITYAIGTIACRTVKTITINPIPAAITGTTTVCAGAATTLYSGAGGTWSSTNTSVGTIGSISTSSARLNALTAGNTTISYTLPTGCTRTTVVTVNPAPNAGAITSSGGFVINTATPPTSVMLSSTGDAGGAWTSNNTTVATIDGTGTVTAAHAGTTNISYTVTLGSCTARATHTVNVVAARAVTTTGSSTSSMTDVSIYPNPNSGVFTVKGMIATEATQAAIEVTNMAGQVVLRNNAVITDGIINEQIQLGANLANGMYMLTLRSGEEIKVFHFVIQ